MGGELSKGGVTRLSLKEAVVRLERAAPTLAISIFTSSGEMANRFPERFTQRSWDQRLVRGPDILFASPLSHQTLRGSCGLFSGQDRIQAHKERACSFREPAPG